MPVGDDEIVVRIVTGPNDYNNGEILRARLTALFSSGVSVIRQGASDSEIMETIEELTRTAFEQRVLIGAVVLKANQIRSLQPERRCYCVFDTPQEGKERHADIMCPMPNEGSKSQNRRWESDRREALQKLFMDNLQIIDTADAVIAAIRAAEAS